jgi:hypothetical protein
MTASPATCPSGLSEPRYGRPPKSSLEEFPSLFSTTRASMNRPIRRSTPAPASRQRPSLTPARTRLRSTWVQTVRIRVIKALPPVTASRDSADQAPPALELCRTDVEERQTEPAISQRRTSIGFLRDESAIGKRSDAYPQRVETSEPAGSKPEPHAHAVHRAAGTKVKRPG